LPVALEKRPQNGRHVLGLADSFSSFFDGAFASTKGHMTISLSGGPVE
jgi:hypothetical protein